MITCPRPPCPLPCGVRSYCSTVSVKGTVSIGSTGTVWPEAELALKYGAGMWRNGGSICMAVYRLYRVLQNCSTSGSAVASAAHRRHSAQRGQRAAQSAACAVCLHTVYRTVEESV